MLKKCWSLTSFLRSQKQGKLKEPFSLKPFYPSFLTCSEDWQKRTLEFCFSKVIIFKSWSLCKEKKILNVGVAEFRYSYVEHWKDKTRDNRTTSSSQYRAEDGTITQRVSIQENNNKIFVGRMERSNEAVFLLWRAEEENIKVTTSKLAARVFTNTKSETNDAQSLPDCTAHSWRVANH